MAGLMVPLTADIGLHVELSLEAEEEPGHPVRLAMGPNWAVWQRLELIPEVAWRHDARGEDSFDFGLAVAVDVSR